MGIISYVTCPVCKNILTASIFTKIICYKGRLKIVTMDMNTCLFCRKDYFTNANLDEYRFEIDMFEDEVDRKVNK